MKKTIIAVALAVASSASAFAQADILVAGWDFEFTPTSYASLAPVGVLAANYSDLYSGLGVNDGVASASRGTLYLNGTNGSDLWTFSGPTATATKNTALGDIDWQIDTRDGGSTKLGGFGGLTSAALGLRTTTETRSEISLVLNTDFLADLDYFSYRTRMQADGVVASIDWSVNVGGNIFALDPAINVSGTNYGLTSVSLASVNWGAASSIQLIGTINNTSSANVLLIDNLGVYGTTMAIPEPSTYAAILGLMSVGIAAFRRRKSVA